MHVATQLTIEMFSITVNGRSASIDDLMPNWDGYDRVGVVVQEPFGAVGATLLMGIGMAKWFAHRRSSGQELNYPEIYVFHVGRRFGDFSSFDVWPPSKEVVVDDDPSAVLQAINDRSITRLLVPDSAPMPVDFFWPERRSAQGRIKNTFAYSAMGRTEGADVVIAGTDPATEENTTFTLDVLPYVNRFRASESRDILRWVDLVDARLHEVSEQDRQSAITSRSALLRDGLATETYRTLTLDDALQRLVCAAGGTASAAVRPVSPCRERTVSCEVVNR